MYADEGGGNPNAIQIDPAMVQDIGVVIAPVERRRLTRTINTYGVVVVDEKGISDINTRVSGWIEELYFDYTGMDVTKGRPMAVIYSPEQITAEQEFLQSVSFASASGNSVPPSNSLIKSARERRKEVTSEDDDGFGNPCGTLTHYVGDRQRSRCDEAHCRADGRRCRNERTARTHGFPGHLLPLEGEGIQVAGTHRKRLITTCKISVAKLFRLVKVP